MSTKLDNASFKWHMIRDVPSLGYTGPGMEVPVKDEVLKHWRKEDKFQGKLILFSHIFRGLISSRGMVALTAMQMYCSFHQNSGGGAGGGWDSIFENDQSAKVLDVEMQMKLFEYSNQITEAEWPSLRQITSPCPTLKVIGAVTKGMVKKEELKRMRELGRPGMDGDDVAPVRIGKRKKAMMVADQVVGTVVGNTVGRVARLAGRRILGEIPDEAKNGSFHDDNDEDTDIDTAPVEVDNLLPDDEANQLLQEAISEQLRMEKSAANEDHDIVDTEDEALFKEIFEGSSNSNITNDVPVETS